MLWILMCAGVIAAWGLLVALASERAIRVEELARVEALRAAERSDSD